MKKLFSFGMAAAMTLSLAACGGAASSAAPSEAASEAITEEMTEAMTDSMPLRALVSFGGYSREELTEIIEKLNKLI